MTGVRSPVLKMLLPNSYPCRARFHAIMVDNGVLRLNEAEQVKNMLTRDLGVNLTVVDASDLFLAKLEGVEDPEGKRKIIGNTFIDIFEAEAAKIEAAAEQEDANDSESRGRIEWLLQGTLYPDVIESISFKGPSATIKTHHNVGGLSENMKLKLIEPLRELFKGVLRRSPSGEVTNLTELPRRGPRIRSSAVDTGPSGPTTPISRTRTSDPNFGACYSGTSCDTTKSRQHLH